MEIVATSSSRTRKAEKTIGGSIARTVAVVGTVAVTAKLAAMAKDLFVAHSYGMGDDLDSYFLSLAVNLFVIGVTAGSLVPAFLPTYVRTSSTRGCHEGARLLSSSLLAAAVILGLLAIVLSLGAPWFVRVLAAGFSPEKAAATVRAMRIMALMIPFGGLSAILSGSMNASGRYAAPAAVPAVTPMVIILLVFGGRGTAGSLILALGTSAGLGIETLLLLAMTWRRGLLAAPSPLSVINELRSVAWQYAPLALGALMTTGAALIDGSMAADLEAGSISVLRYGSKLVTFVVEIVGLSLSAALLPIFSKIVAPGNGSRDSARKTFISCLIPVLAVTIPVSAVLYLSAGPMVKILLERGNFSPENTAAVAEIQKIFALQIPFFAIALIGVRMLSALLLGRIVLIVSGIDFSVKISLNLLLYESMGVRGLAVATTAMHAVSAIVIVLTLLRFVGHDRLPGEASLEIDGCSGKPQDSDILLKPESKPKIN